MNLMHLLFSFQGRIRRLHYWLAALGTAAVFSVVIGIVAAVMGVAMGGSDPNAAGAGMGVGLLVIFALYIPLIWISLALQAKRWHDRDKSAVWILINLIPVVGGIWALIECGFLDGTPGPNRFGPSPKYGDQNAGYGGYGGQPGATVVS